LIRRFNITHLLENGKRIIPLDLIIDYRFIKIDEVVKISIWCTTNNKGYRCLGVQTLFKPTDNNIPLSYTLDFNTDILTLKDKEATGLFIHIDNAEFIELKRLSIVYNMASRITGRTTDADQWIDPNDDRLFVLPFIPSISMAIDWHYVTPFIASTYEDTVEEFTVTPFGISIEESNYVIPFVPSTLSGYVVTPFIASTFVSNIVTPFEISMGEQPVRMNDNLFFLGDYITPPEELADNLFFLGDLIPVAPPTITHNTINNTIEMT